LQDGEWKIGDTGTLHIAYCRLFNIGFWKHAGIAFLHVTRQKLEAIDQGSVLPLPLLKGG
jgi:hypothetical protein